MLDSSLPHKSKTPIAEVGQPCRHCSTPVVERLRKEPHKHGKGLYWYCRILRCPKCHAIYLQDPDRRPYSDTSPMPVQPQAIDKDEVRAKKAERRRQLKLLAKSAKRAHKAERRASRKEKRQSKPHSKSRREIYIEYINSAEWRAFRKTVIEVRGSICERCGSEGSVDVHHLTYERLMLELPEDVKLLCRDCHKLEHKSVGKSKKRK